MSSRRTPQEIALEFIEANKAHDANRISSLFSQDYESFHPQNVERNYKGSDQVRKNQELVYDNINLDSLKVTVLKITASSTDSVVIEACFSAERKSDNVQVNEVMVWSFDINEDGLIRRGRVYMYSLDTEKTRKSGGIEQYLKMIVDPSSV